jgi:signal transduction histidine kinase
MKKICLLPLFFLICICSNAQPLPGTVKMPFDAAKTDADKGRIIFNYFDANIDNDTIFKQIIPLKKYFEEKKNAVIVDYIRVAISRHLSRESEYAESINELFQLLPNFLHRKDEFGVMICNRHLSYAYYAAADKEQTIFYDKKTVDLSIPLATKFDLAYAYNNLGADLAEYGYYDSSAKYCYAAVTISKEINDSILICKTLGTLGEYFIAIKEFDSALVYIRGALKISMLKSKFDLAFGFNDLSQIYQAKQQTDSSIYFATMAARISSQINSKAQLLRSYKYLSALYRKKGSLDSAYKYLSLEVSTNDSIYSIEKNKQLQLINIREENRKREADQQKLELQNKIKIYALISGLVVFTFIAVILYRNSRKEKKAKIILQKKNTFIEQTLGDLKATQSQLIQSEKMASLGELTAGIAHEIQNPLNFVNNFSELSNELIDEMKEELLKGNYEDANSIADDIKQNLEKINHHGKRADAIVKGMLQHSRSSNGVKEPTDINALADEYLRLSYHGLRAKDKTFNATLKTDYDESIGNINIIPQDIGRVLLNLYNNAFYAVAEKKKQQPEVYEPTVSVVTKKMRGKISISIKDNGNGIPQKIADKIFQPFFTTKPTGQGTGLGLSLSYDIVKAHGGEIKVETKKARTPVQLSHSGGDDPAGRDERTEFIIVLPVS